MISRDDSRDRLRTGRSARTGAAPSGGRHPWIERFTGIMTTDCYGRCVAKPWTRRRRFMRQAGRSPLEAGGTGEQIIRQPERAGDHGGRSSTTRSTRASWRSLDAVLRRGLKVSWCRCRPSWTGRSSGRRTWTAEPFDVREAFPTSTNRSGSWRADRRAGHASSAFTLCSYPSRRREEAGRGAKAFINEPEAGTARLWGPPDRVRHRAARGGHRGGAARLVGGSFSPEDEKYVLPTTAGC